MRQKKKSAADELIDAMPAIYEGLVAFTFIATFVQELLKELDKQTYPLEKAPQEKDSSLAIIKEGLR